jgi:uncharacterized DUF497 family protein
VFDRYEYEWDDDNVGHIARHDVEPWEAEEAVSDAGRAPFPARGKDRVGAIGTTEDGRLLVVIVQRAERASESIRRVVMARDATEGEKRIYRRRNR